MFGASEGVVPALDRSLRTGGDRGGTGWGGGFELENGLRR
jgi:hypothetical protein